MPMTALEARQSALACLDHAEGGTVVSRIKELLLGMLRTRHRADEGCHQLIESLEMRNASKSSDLAAVFDRLESGA